MHAFNIALPLKTNDGKGDYARQLVVWEELALDEGGFTTLGDRRGSWISDTGAVMSETMRHYQFAGSEQAMGRLIDAARQLFLDQVAFYVVRLGEAVIVPAFRGTMATPLPATAGGALTQLDKSERPAPKYAGKLRIEP